MIIVNHYIKEFILIMNDFNLYNFQNPMLFFEFDSIIDLIIIYYLILIMYQEILCFLFKYLEY